jgi:aspartate/methionine/tyrosine aminotransferase
MRLSPFRLERYFSDREFNAPWMLGASDCETLSVQELLAMREGAAQELMALELGYTEPAGDPALRSAIAEHYSSLRSDGILVLAAGEEAILTTLLATVASRDRVVVHSPCYQSLIEIPRALGCEVIPWETREEDRWCLDLDFLRDALRTPTRLVIVNCPHNPTGASLPPDEWKELVEIVEAGDALLLSDEAYRGTEYRREDCLPPACDLSERAFSIGLTSKGLGLPGLRIGWLASRHPLLARVEEVKDYTTICTSGPSQFLATIALANAEWILERNRSILRSNLATLEAFMCEHRDTLDWIPPVAGPVAFPHLRLGLTADELCRRSLAETGVLLLPGTVFQERSRKVRIGFGRRDFPKALERFSAVLDRQRPGKRRQS